MPDFIKPGCERSIIVIGLRIMNTDCMYVLVSMGIASFESDKELGVRTSLRMQLRWLGTGYTDTSRNKYTFVIFIGLSYYLSYFSTIESSTYYPSSCSLVIFVYPKFLLLSKYTRNATY